MNQTISVLNPLSEDLGIMRTSLLPGLIQNLSHNYRYGSHFGRLFETGYVFSQIQNECLQYSRLALVSWGLVESLWQKPNPSSLVFEMKSNIELLFKYLGIE